MVLVENKTEEAMNERGTTNELRPSWVDQVENLLTALEMYRVEEEKAIHHLAEILCAYGIDVSAEEIRTAETEVIKTTVREKVEVR